MAVSGMIKCVVEGDRVRSWTHLRRHQYEITTGQAVVEIQQECPVDRNGEPMCKADVHFDGAGVVPGAPQRTEAEKDAAARAQLATEYDILDIAMADETERAAIRARYQEIRGTV